MKKIGVYIDTNNLYQSLKHSHKGRQLDYAKLAGHVKDMGDIVDALAYGSEFENEATEFKCMLAKIGITPKYKQIIPSRKFSWNTTIVVDVISKLDTLDAVVLCTGDGDLTPLVKHIVDNGKKVIIIACSPSKSLRVHASSTIEIYEDLLCT